ncbi:MAG: ATP synthase F0 subunit A [Halobacteriovoraceae bacterium]|nr:ATP synthase F0 subunit A [Halobacteriovoraceae bacterium]
MLLRFLSVFSFFLILPSDSHAAGGFTWVSSLINAFHIPLPEHVLTFGLTCFLIFVIGLVYKAKVAKADNYIIPDKGFSLRNLVDSYGQFIMGQCKSVIGEKDGPEYFPFVATIFIVILVNNMIGIIPGFLPPTEQTSTTLALGVFSFMYYNYIGCKKLGVVNYLKHFAGPLWYMAILIFPIEILSNFVRPLSLALRLRGNMMGDHMVLAVFSDLVPGIVPIVFLILGMLVSFIQAYVFTCLSMVYISLASAHHDHDEHH